MQTGTNDTRAARRITLGRKLLLVACKRNEGYFVNSTVKSILFWVFILACLVLLWQIVQEEHESNGKDQGDLLPPTFMDDARQGQVQDVTITNSTR